MVLICFIFSPGHAIFVGISARSPVRIQDFRTLTILGPLQAGTDGSDIVIAEIRLRDLQCRLIDIFVRGLQPVAQQLVTNHREMVFLRHFLGICDRKIANTLRAEIRRYIPLRNKTLILG